MDSEHLTQNLTKINRISFSVYKEIFVDNLFVGSHLKERLSSLNCSYIILFKGINLSLHQNHSIHQSDAVTPLCQMRVFSS